MTRRKIVTAAVAAPLAAAPPPAGESRHILVLRRYQLRNGAENMAVELTGFLEKVRQPALERAGAAGLGYFTSFLAAGMPFLLELESYPSMAALDQALSKLESDTKYRGDLTTFHRQHPVAFVRESSQVMRAFSGWPAVVTPASAKAPRLFELRTYESNNRASLAEKVRMFNEGEIRVFKATGLEPVFFGETLYGDQQPNLTYMLWYDDLAARDTNWKKFVGHPDWDKLKKTPGWSDAEIVSNISSGFLRGLPFSAIR